jgi:hypothetical protein
MTIVPFYICIIASISVSNSDFTNQFNLRLNRLEKYLDSVWIKGAEPRSNVYIPQDSAKPSGDEKLNSIVGRLRTISDIDSFVIDRDSMIFFKTSLQLKQKSQSMKLPTELIAIKALDSLTKNIPGGYYRTANAIGGPTSWFKINGKKEIFIEHARFSSGEQFKNHARLIAIIDFLKDYAWNQTSEHIQKEIEELEIK